MVSGMTGVLLIGTAATANATPAPAAQAPLAVSSTVSLGAGDCIDTLQNWGYAITTRRRAICSVASFPFPSQPTRIATCTAALIVTGVGPFVAPAACTLATV